MKKTIKIASLFLLIAWHPFKAEAFFGYQILHLKVFSYPAGAGKFAAANYYFDYDQGERLNHYQKYGENLSVNDYFELYVKEDSYLTELDTLMIVAYMDGYEDGYMVKVKPVDENYMFLGFVHSKYIGQQYDFWYYYQQSNEYPYYRPNVNESDFSYNIEDAKLLDYDDFLFVMTDNKTIIHYAVDFWAGGIIHPSQVIAVDNDMRQYIWPIDENTFPENPNDYCIGVFTRVFLTNEDRENVIIYPRANEIGDEVTFTCTRDDFDYWIEEGTGRHIAENPYTFTVTGKETYTAHFGDPSKVAPLQLPRGGENGSSSSDAHHSSSVYDLQGRKVNVNDKKGIYIKNGRKQVIR